MEVDPTRVSSNVNLLCRMSIFVTLIGTARGPLREQVGEGEQQQGWQPAAVLNKLRCTGKYSMHASLFMARVACTVHPRGVGHGEKTREWPKTGVSNTFMLIVCVP